MMQRIPIHASTERRQKSLVGQLEYHSNRRLLLLDENQRRNRNLKQQEEQQEDDYDEDTNLGTVLSYHPAEWRRVLQSNTTSSSSLQQQQQPLITSVELSNCHLVLYSGEIALGSNRQVFRVDFDTASSDLWIAGTDCTECPIQHPTWRLFNATQSSTYKPATATQDAQQNAFNVQYDDGEMVHGNHALDTLWLGEETLQIKDQVFAVVTQIDNFATCQEEEGILGLANTLTTSHQFPSLLSNFIHTNALKNNVFGMYLQAQDDYPNDDEGSWQRQNNQQQQQHHPLGASSQLVLGGVDQTHYLGCLQWHSMVDSADNQDDNNDTATVGRGKSNYWSLPLQQVKVGGQTLSQTQQSPQLVAILDSGSSYIVGPQKDVAQLVQMNGAKCFTMENFNGASPKQVPCDQDDGFDGAILSSCNDPFFSLEFDINGQVYVLEKEDLMVQVETLFGEACILRIVGAEGMTGWVLGDAFLNKYYAAFDFENQKIGLALAAKEALDVCDADRILDISNFWDTFVDVDPEDQQDTITSTTTTTEEQEAQGNTNNHGNGGGNVVEVYDIEDQDLLPIGGDDEDFDFTGIAAEPSGPPPAHNEPPERQPVPHITNPPSEVPAVFSATTTTTTTTTSGLDSSITTQQSSSTNVAIYAVAAIVVSAIVALVLFRKTKRRRQQAMFQDAWREAEKEIIQSHRNLNYRDHDAVQSNSDHNHNHVLTIAPYRDGGSFHDHQQEGTTNSSSSNEVMDFDDEEQQHRDTFVLDTIMLDKMN
ncbi:aspartyl protease [Nitzschia inconspicua]|uniref:Aspartyl protease n=1 Tax=Nitzschia inconspicua TaxID=303405 RepID=A0A9K3Q373_9STRA|nr:aspartyl protease [Nitzschia inconspicua]KAG7369343.1 aspartyl protease [Nitzschia inconspicua]